MGKIKKGYFKYFAVLLIVLGMYFIIEYVTSLNIFPKKVNSSPEYVELIQKYGNPIILKKTSPKFIKTGLTIIPGKKCQEKKFIELKSSTNIEDESTQNNVIDKVILNFESYVKKLNNTLKTTSTQTELDTKEAHQVDKNISEQKEIKDKAKYFRASKYRSLLLASFKVKDKFIIIPVEECIYQCTFPYKTSFHTYKLKNNDCIIYSKKSISETQIDSFLKNKLLNDNKIPWISKWEAKRSKIDQKQFYRLYTLTIPTATTCITIKDRLILFGSNIHKNHNLINTITENIKLR